VARASCLGGGIQFEADEIPLRTNCRCSICRKASGAAFGACRVCGSNNVPVVQEGRQSVVIPAGALDDDLGARPALHLFRASKAPCWEIQDSLLQFEEWTPGYDSPSVGTASERSDVCGANARTTASRLAATREGVVCWPPSTCGAR